MLKKTKRYVAIALCVFLMATTVIAVNLTTGSSSFAATSTGNVYYDRFLSMYDKIHNSANGYFSPDGVPYHSIETMMCEAPDYGHETSSETWSYYTWLEAMYGNITGDWAGFNKAWDLLEKYAIPSDLDQPNLNGYDPNKCASFVPGGATPEEYPTQLNLTAPTGKDPLHSQLISAYGKNTMYLMHWIYDTDNWYGYGNHGDGQGKNSQINTYQRGEQESCWETVVFPCWETLKWGNPTKGGFGAIFIKQDSYAAQWRYSVASDADARAVQTAYEALLWANDKSAISAQLQRASKLGDYLRYSMLDKYMKPIGPNTTINSPAGTGYDSMHYLISWYCAWGAPTSPQGWAWKEGSSASHQGYQNPLAAYALSAIPDLKPKSSNGAADWAKSLTTQLDFLQWLQSSEGALAGGCNNSIGDKYDPYPAGISTFNGMAYDWEPVWHDPPSNRWFGFQTWGLQRLAEYYYVSGDVKAKAILDKWVDWVLPNIHFLPDGTFEIPSDMSWSGQPDTWAGSYTGNPNLHVTIDTWGKDLGVAGSLCDLLAFYAKKANDTEAADVAKRMLDIMWNKYQDDKGIAIEEARGDYDRFFETEIYIPKDWTGTNAQGATLKNGMKFIDQRPKYKQDPNWTRLQNAYNSNTDFTITYHRFWGQTDIAVAYGVFGMLYPNASPSSSTNPSPTATTPAGNKLDIDKNGAINLADILLVAAAFNTTPADPRYKVEYDLDNNGAITLADIMLIAAKFNTVV